MTELGDLLEAMHTAHRRYRSLTATFHEFVDRELDRHAAQMYEAWEDEGENHAWIEQLDTYSRLVLDPPRLRIERDPDDHLAEATRVILDGARRFFDSPGWGAEVGDQTVDDLARALGPALHLLAPASLLAPLELTAPTRTEVDGRTAWHVHATPRWPLPWPLGGADEHELWVDVERGVVLRLVGLILGSAVRVHELQDIRFDVTVPVETFTLPPTSSEITGLGLREVTRLASFDLWALPLPVQNVTYRPARGLQRPEVVTLEYDGLLLVETPVHDRTTYVPIEEPHIADAAGRQYVVTNGRLVMWADGTQVELQAPGLDETRLVEVAETLTKLDA